MWNRRAALTRRNVSTVTDDSENTASSQSPRILSIGNSPTLPPSDATLIEECLKGDMEAWTALIDRYSGLIYGTAWQFNLPPEDVADVYQSVTVALLEGLSELREPDKFNSWLTTVTVHECFRVKRRRTRSLASLEDMKEEVSNIPDHSALPDELVQRDENRQLVRQALAMMEEPCRSLLTHLFYEKELWTYEQIANEYGVSVSTIGPKRSRCLKKLLQNLKTLGM